MLVRAAKPTQHYLGDDLEQVGVDFRAHLRLYAALSAQMYAQEHLQANSLQLQGRHIAFSTTLRSCFAPQLYAATFARSYPQSCSQVCAR